jgi:hypothetical protein
MAPKHTFGTIVAVSALLTGLLTGVGWAESRVTAAAVSISGAGATFPVPLYKKWIAAYQESHPTVAITYQGVGSGEGGALVMSYILARGGYPPFVLTAERARDFFNWSTLFSAKRKSGLLLRWQMPLLTRNFAEFLIAQADPRFLRARRD